MSGDQEVDEESSSSTHSPVDKTRLWTSACAYTAGQVAEWKGSTAGAINSPISHQLSSHRCFINIPPALPIALSEVSVHATMAIVHSEAESCSSLKGKIISNYVVLLTSTQDEVFPGCSNWQQACQSDKRHAPIPHDKLCGETSVYILTIISACLFNK